MYEIITRNRYGHWDNSQVGSDIEDNRFATEQDAWDAIEELRNLGDDWADAEYDVREVDPSLTLAEAAELLGMSADTLRRQAGAGKLRAERVATLRGPIWMTTAEAVERYRREHRRD